MTLLCLVGLPGSGKTTLGKQVAQLMPCCFRDSDQTIEHQNGCSISDYFAEYGESAFRHLEHETLKKFTQRTGVLSTGGGVVLLEDNRLILRAHCVVVYLHVYLHVSPEVLYARLRHDQSRLLLQVNNGLNKLRELYEERDALYRETAHHVVECSYHSAHDTLESVMGIMMAAQ